MTSFGPHFTFRDQDQERAAEPAEPAKVVALASTSVGAAGKAKSKKCSWLPAKTVGATATKDDLAKEEVSKDKVSHSL